MRWRGSASGGARRLRHSFLLVRAVPPIAFVIPYFLLWRDLDQVQDLITFSKSYPAIIVMYLTLALPLMVWMLRSFFVEVPVEIEEAAMVDGCTRAQAMRHVLIPNVMPGIVAAAGLSFIVVWNEFMYALFNTGTETQTLPVQIYQSLGYFETNWAKLSSAAVVAVIPAVLFVALTQRYIVRGSEHGSGQGMSRPQRARVTVITFKERRMTQDPGPVPDGHHRGGHFAEANHYPSLSHHELQGVVERVAVCDLRPDRARELADALRLGRILHRPRRDAGRASRSTVSSSALGGPHHPDLACLVLAAGLPVFLEKPAAIDVDGHAAHRGCGRASGTHRPGGSPEAPRPGLSAGAARSSRTRPASATSSTSNRSSSASRSSRPSTPACSSGSATTSTWSSPSADRSRRSRRRPTSSTTGTAH